jgi:hypothetical protein
MAYKSRMGRKPVKPEKQLKHFISTRLDHETYQKLAGLLPRTAGYNMSRLIRRILENRPVKVFTRDQTFDPVIAELGAIRLKLKRTGIAINQYTKSVHTSDQMAQQLFFAKLAFSQYAALEPEIDRLLEIVTSCAKRWLDSPPS